MKHSLARLTLGVFLAVTWGMATSCSAPRTTITPDLATETLPIPSQASFPQELLSSPFAQRWNGTGVLIEGVLPSRKYGQYRLMSVWQSIVEDGVQVIYAGESKMADGRLSGRGIVLLNILSSDESKLLVERRFETDRGTGALKIVDVSKNRVVLLCVAGYPVTLDLETESFSYGSDAVNEVTIETGILKLNPDGQSDPNAAITTAWMPNGSTDDRDAIYVGTESSTQLGLVRAWDSNDRAWVDYKTQQPTGWLSIFDVRGSVVLLSDQFGGVHGYSLADRRYLESNEADAIIRVQTDHVLLPVR